MELGLINQQLSNSTTTLQNTFIENVQALNALSAENSTLKSMLGNSSVCDPRRERIMVKLQERRQLLSLVKTARVAAEVTRRKGKSHEVPAAAFVQAKLYQNDDSIVSVMRTGEWVEAIALKKKDSCVQWIEYIDDGVQEAVSDERIAKSRKRRLLHYTESPQSPKVKKQRKEGNR